MRSVIKFPYNDILIRFKCYFNYWMLVQPFIFNQLECFISAKHSCTLLKSITAAPVLFNLALEYLSIHSFNRQRLIYKMFLIFCPK